MAERLPTNKPTSMVGTILNSGSPNTGQLPLTQGGDHMATSWSGTAGGDACLWVGGGRLDAAFFHDSAILALSGQPVTFYDAAVAVSGGGGSGYKIVGQLSPGMWLNLTNASGAPLRGGEVRSFGFVFTSGLCYASKSGQPGFSVSFTPVVSG